jgi:hypothetical protein
VLWPAKRSRKICNHLLLKYRTIYTEPSRTTSKTIKLLTNASRLERGILGQIAAGGGEQVDTGRAAKLLQAFEWLAGNSVVREVPVRVYVYKDHWPVVQAGTGYGE